MINVGSEQYVLELLSNDTFLMVNKSLLRQLKDCDEAIVLTELVSAYKYFKDQTTDGWFFQTVDYLERDLGMTYYRQCAAINSLIKKQLVQTKRLGMPARRFFKLDMRNIQALLLDCAPVILKEVVSKKEFYTAITKARTYDEFMRATGNISEELSQMMWLWKEHCRGTFQWNAKEFTQIKNLYIRLKKPVDWGRLVAVMDKSISNAIEPSIWDFSETEKGEAENPIQYRVTTFKENM